MLVVIETTLFQVLFRDHDALVVMLVVIETTLFRTNLRTGDSGGDRDLPSTFRASPKLTAICIPTQSLGETEPARQSSKRS
jgi:hypothetical protein